MSSPYDYLSYAKHLTSSCYKWLRWRESQANVDNKLDVEFPRKFKGVHSFYI